MSEGKDVTIIVYGVLFGQAIEAIEILEKKGLSVGLINLRTVKPVDEEAILNAAVNSKLLVTLEDHFITGGLYSITAELFLRNKIICDVLPIALKDSWFKPSLLQDVLEYEGFTGKKIADRIFNYK